ncbi:hypothetical protein NQZ71_10370 [Niallia taxi]|uniref:hypothetical protein n=1 Tax=Niallia taxi TaxID=2499688 RepID=UPI0021A4EEAA|nr:hypothetical protein [Niallia taxi]MCT2344770.1 hypothetical protein [Niallia taxi]MDE5053415.1 hypothetical protein [Niallia taxi]WOD61238.1 hypothetical protein NQZ71_10370 [Niallia taxi]
MRIIPALFSIIMPGFGQIYNRELVKGIIFVILEHFDNMLGRINQAIALDINGFHQQAIDATNFEVMLFYPGFYVYAVWDSWFYAREGGDKAKTAIPFIIAGFLGEIASLLAPKIPYPTLTIGMLMIVPMLIGMYVFRDQ